MDDFLVLLQAKLDEAKSKGNVNADIDKIQDQINKLKVQVEIDPKTISNLVKQLEGVLNQKINISNINIDTNSVIKEAKQTGQRIGNTINKEITNATNKASNTLKSFADLRNFSELNKSINNFHVDTSELKNYKSILDDVKNTYAEFGQVRITNEIFQNGVLEKFKVNIEQVNGDLKETRSFIMALNDEQDAFVFSGLISGSESIVQHLDKTKNAVNQTAEAINALKEKAKIDEIQLSTDVDTLTTKYQKFGVVSKEVENNLKELRNAKEAVLNSKNTGDPSAKIEQYNEALKRAKASITELTTQEVSLSKRTAQMDGMRNWMLKNQNAVKLVGAEVDKLIKECETCDSIRFEGIKREFRELQTQAREAGKLGNSLWGSIKEQFEKFTQWFSVTSLTTSVLHAGKQVVNNVSKIDVSLVELSKVSDLTADGLEKVTDQAFELGKSLSKTGTDVLDAVTNFKRAGYDISDSMKYAEEALKTTNISENLKDAGQAADSLVNIMKGFQNESPEFARKINDAVNQVSNTEAVDFDNLIDGATRLSAVADQAGMSFEQMLGTLTGGYEILGNMEKVATGQITIFSRLQAIQLDGEEEVSTVAKLQETFNNATKGAVNIVDQTTGQLRNVFDILDDIANVWDSLDKNTREALAIEASGIRQKNVFLAMMQNWEGVKDAVESASNSFGSADEENEKYIKSIQGRVENFERSVQQLSRTLLDSDLVKWFVDLGTTGVNAIDKIVDKLGPLVTIGLGAGLFAGFKNVGGWKNVSLICYLF